MSKKHPRHQSREGEDGIRQTIGWYLCQAAEKQAEDQHGEERLQNRPGSSQRRLLVSNLQVAPDKKRKEFPELE
jgi:hypothetical protein